MSETVTWSEVFGKPPLEGRALQYDRAWKAIIADDHLMMARRKLSIHELRTLINHCLDATA